MNREILNYLENLGIATFPIIQNTKNPDVPIGYMKKSYDGNYEKLTINDNDNFGVIGGINNLLIIDLDNSKLLDEFTSDKSKLFQNTIVVETGKGHHIYVKCPDAQNMKVFRGKDEIDLKGPGGYCVGPTSTYIPTQKDIDEKKYSADKESGFEYKLLSNSDKLIYMKWDDVVSTISKMGFEFKDKKTFKEIAKEGLREGSRNDALFKYLANLRGTHDFDDLELFEEANRFNQSAEKPLPKDEVENTVNSVISRIDAGGDLIKTKSGKVRRKYSNDDEGEDWESEMIQKIDELIEEYDIITFYQNNKWISYRRKDGIHVEGIEDLMKKLFGDTLIKPHTANRIIYNLRQKSIRGDNPFEDRRYIFYTNGVLDAKTNKFSTNYTGKYSLTKLPYDYIEDSQDTTLVDIFKKKYKDSTPYIFRVISNSLLYENKEKLLHIIVGPGDSGKTTDAEILLEALGTNRISTQGLIPAITGNFKTAHLHNKSLLLDEEITSENFQKHIEKIKRWVGGLGIEAEAKYGTSLVSLNPKEMTILIGTNKLPQMDTEDDAFWRRVNLIFVDSIPKEDQIDGLVQKICTSESMSYLIKFCLENHTVKLPKNSAEHNKKSWQQNSDPEYQFVQEGFLIKEEGNILDFDVIWNRLCEYASEKKTKTNPRKNFINLLREQGYKIEKYGKSHKMHIYDVGLKDSELTQKILDKDCKIEIGMGTKSRRMVYVTLSDGTTFNRFCKF